MGVFTVDKRAEVVVVFSPEKKLRLVNWWCCFERWGREKGATLHSVCISQKCLIVRAFKYLSNDTFARKVRDQWNPYTMD